MGDGVVTERALVAADLPAVRALVRRCLAADGGLPLAGEDRFLGRRYFAGPGVGLFDYAGELVAAASLGPPGDGARLASGVVDTGWRGRGLGRHLLSWTFEAAGGDPVVAAAENLTDAAEHLYARYGLVPIFGELIMRCPLPPAGPPADPPDGVTFEPWTHELAPAFFTAYSASFADRPGFPAPEPDDWIGETITDDGFRPDLCLLARDPDGRPVGFLTVAQSWIGQTGVVPGWRRRGLGAAMVTRTLARLAAENRSECLLTVATDNPGAVALYRSHGFVTAGRRGRFALA